VQLGVKYGFRNKLVPGYDTSAGLNLYFPLGHPPLDLTNGYSRFSPYFVIGRRVDTVPGLQFFLNTGLNLLSKSSVPGTFDQNESQSSSFILAPGLVYDRHPLHYTLEISYETTALIGSGNQTFLTLRPGVAWDLPRTLKFNSRGRWLIGFGFHATFGPDGVTSGTGAKLRAEFGVFRWLHRDKKSPQRRLAPNVGRVPHPGPLLSGQNPSRSAEYLHHVALSLGNRSTRPRPSPVSSQ
jgi:hypothetical protein